LLNSVVVITGVKKEIVPVPNWIMDICFPKFSFPYILLILVGNRTKYEPKQNPCSDKINMPGIGCHNENFLINNSILISEANNKLDIIKIIPANLL